MQDQEVRGASENGELALSGEASPPSSETSPSSMDGAIATKVTTRLELTTHGEVCGSRYVGSLLQSGDTTYDFIGVGMQVTLAPTDWVRSTLRREAERATLCAYGRRLGQRITVREFPRDDAATTNFRAVMNQLKTWSTLKAKLAFSCSLGPCTQVFVSEMQMDGLGEICFQDVCLDGKGSFLTVDIRKYDEVEVGILEVPARAGRPALAPRTVVTLRDCATGTSLEISDALMNYPQVLNRFISGTA